MPETKSFDASRLGMIAIGVFLLIVAIDEMTLFLPKENWGSVYFPAGNVSAVAFAFALCFAVYSCRKNKKLFPVFSWFAVIFLCGMALFLNDWKFLNVLFPEPNFGRPIMCVGFGLAVFSLMLGIYCFKNRKNKPLFFVFLLLAIAFVLEAGADDMFRDGEVKTILEALYAHKSLHTVKACAGVLILMSGIIILLFNGMFCDENNDNPSLDFTMCFVISYCLAMTGFEFILVAIDSRRHFVDYHYFAPIFFMVLCLVSSVLFLIASHLRGKEKESMFLIFTIIYLALFIFPNVGTLTVKSDSANGIVAAIVLLIAVALISAIALEYRKDKSIKNCALCATAMTIPLIVFEFGLFSAEVNYDFVMVSGMILFAVALLLAGSGLFNYHKIKTSQ